MATTGIKYPSTVAWPGATNPNNVLTLDSTRGTATISSGETMISTWGYNLAIPTDATNIKIILYLTGSITAGSFYSYHFARNVNTGTPVSVSSRSVLPGATETTIIASDDINGGVVWNQKSGPANWTPADLNDTFFGWQLSFGANVASSTLSVNAVAMEVTYDQPTGSATGKWWWGGWTG